MLNRLLPRLHVRIAPDLLTVRNLKSGASVSEVPELALGGTPRKLLAAGAQARVAAAQMAVAAQAGAVAKVDVVNPFAHPRSLVSDFTSAEALLRFFVRRVLGNTFLLPRPLVFLQPVGVDEGGYTQVERRALHELALGAGASYVVLCTGAALTEAEMREMKVGAKLVER